MAQPTEERRSAGEAAERANLGQVRGVNSTDKLYTATEIEEIIGKRVAERLQREEEAKWLGTVNQAIDAIGKHVGADGAHPRLLVLLASAVQATERMEKILVTASPEDITKFLPMLIEKEKREEADKVEREEDMRQLKVHISWGLGLAVGIITLVQFLLHYVLGR